MSKEETYKHVIPQIQALIAEETDLIANMANIAAALHEAFHFWWTGFYLVKANGERANGEGTNGRKHNAELVLGPFQGPIACTRIPYGKGVCGTAWAQAKTIIVPNVHEFAGHIACSSESNSEIVVPVFRKKGTGENAEKEIIAVLDIDSKAYNNFDKIDQIYLEQLCQMG